MWNEGAKPAISLTETATDFPTISMLLFFSQFQHHDSTTLLYHLLYQSHSSSTSNTCFSFRYSRTTIFLQNRIPKIPFSSFPSVSRLTISLLFCISRRTIDLCTAWRARRFRLASSPRRQQRQRKEERKERKEEKNKKKERKHKNMEKHEDEWESVQRNIEWGNAGKARERDFLPG